MKHQYRCIKCHADPPDPKEKDLCLSCAWDTEIEAVTMGDPQPVYYGDYDYWPVV